MDPNVRVLHTDAPGLTMSPEESHTTVIWTQRSPTHVASIRAEPPQPRPAEFILQSTFPDPVTSTAMPDSITLCESLTANSTLQLYAIDRGQYS